MPLVSLYSLVVFLVLMGAQLWRPHLLFKVSKWTYWLSAFFVFFISGYLTVQQYRIWELSPVTRLLLPPNQPFGYFQQYALTHFWTNLMVAFAVSLLALVAAKVLNRNFGSRFFWPEEPWLFATALLLAGHPGLIYYVISLFTSFLLFAIGYVLFAGRNERITMYYFWIPVATLIVILSTWFKFPFSN